MEMHIEIVQEDAGHPDQPGAAAVGVRDIGHWSEMAVSD
jgi:hypothetical protein